MHSWQGREDLWCSLPSFYLNLFISKYSRVTYALRMKLWYFFQLKTVSKTALAQVSTELAPVWHVKHSILLLKMYVNCIKAKSWLILPCKVNHLSYLVVPEGFEWSGLLPALVDWGSMVTLGGLFGPSCSSQLQRESCLQHQHQAGVLVPVVDEKDSLYPVLP